MAWEPEEVKEIRKQSYYDGKNKRLMRKHEGCNRTAYIYNTDADTEKELERIAEIKTKISEKETIQIAKDNLRRLRLRIKMPKDIIHLFDDLLIRHDNIYFPYLTHTENLIIRHRANGKSLPQIAKAMLPIQPIISSIFWLPSIIGYFIPTHFKFYNWR